MVYKVYINDGPWFDFDLFNSKVKFGQKCSLCLYQTNSQVIVYRTIGHLVFNDVTCVTPQGYQHRSATHGYFYDNNYLKKTEEVFFS